jgi:hypothetical protein
MLSETRMEELVAMLMGASEFGGCLKREEKRTGDQDDWVLAGMVRSHTDNVRRLRGDSFGAVKRIDDGMRITSGASGR